MGRGFDMPYVEGSKYHRERVKITWIEDQNIMDKWLDIPCVGDQNSMIRGVKIPWVEGSISHM